MVSNSVFRLAVLSALALGLASCATLVAQDATPVVEQSLKAMGGERLGSIRFAAKGSGASYGQAFRPDMPWPKVNLTHFVRIADYDNGAFGEEAARTRAEPTGGGAIPLMGTGEQRTSGMMHDGFAWNMVGPAPVAAPLTVTTRLHDLWTTPHGVLKAALRNKASMLRRTEDGKTYWAVSFTEPGRFMATALINAEGLVERVESRLPNPVAGDVDVVTRYSAYRDHMGVRFPGRIEQSQGGHPTLDLEVTEILTNLRPGITAPQGVRQFAERVVVEEAADGVWFLAGGSHNSVAIEMKDHMVVVEAPLYDGRSAPMLDAVKALAPGKPIRFVINSHHHFDHSGGLRTAAAEGATLVTSAIAKPYFEKTLANPNRISPDRLAQSGRRAEILGVDGRRTFSDGARSFEVYSINDSVHANGFNMVYLPKERILIQADAYTPGAPGAGPSNPVNGNALNLVSNIERLNLNVARILPLHGRIVNLAELHRFIGR
jgi:glyoxylase-like metal-dependent hydrolase (beta-lactamase superfamily II)